MQVCRRIPAEPTWTRPPVINRDNQQPPTRPCSLHLKSASPEGHLSPSHSRNRPDYHEPAGLADKRRVTKEIDRALTAGRIDIAMRTPLMSSWCCQARDGPRNRPLWIHEGHGRDISRTQHILADCYPAGSDDCSGIALLRVKHATAVSNKSSVQRSVEFFQVRTQRRSVIVSAITRRPINSIVG